jgi:hypothetical protein
VIAHPQSLITIQRCQVYVVLNGKSISTLCPVRLPEIKPHPDAPEPKIIPIPRSLVDPVSEVEVSTGDASAPEGQLIIRTSEASMRWK